ncbi:MAG: hypothetical protein QOJ00_247 [Actinomycetota bacterium]|jgi:undecaprenyl-diphosphatase
MSLGGNAAVIGVVIIVAAINVIGARRWRFAFAVTSALVASSVVAIGLKQVIRRPRPPANLALVHLSGWAMPSTHAARTAAIAAAAIGTITWLPERERRAVAAAAVVAVGIVGVVMVYVGGHWLSDVLVGWALGAAIGGGSVVAARRLFAESGARSH